MKILHITVKNKIAVYCKRDGDIVCGNGDYQVKFTFDEEWDSSSEKTARFIWNGKYYDVKFTGDTCKVPVISNTESVQVGVYTEDDALQTTTSAVIGCKRSVRCGGESEHPESSVITYGEVLQTANDAKTTAEEAKTTAEEAETTAEEAKTTAEEAKTTAEKAKEIAKGKVSKLFRTHPDELPQKVYACDGDNGEAFRYLAVYFNGVHQVSPDFIPVYTNVGVDDLVGVGFRSTIPVGDPTGKYDASNKKYVDSSIKETKTTATEAKTTADEAKTTAEEAKTTAEEAKLSVCREINPSDVRKAGYYKVTAVREHSDTNVHIMIYYLDEDGEIDDKLEEFVMNADGALEETFILHLPNDMPYGLYVDSPCDCKMYEPASFDVGLIGDIGTALDELHSYAQALVNGGAS